MRKGGIKDFSCYDNFDYKTSVWDKFMERHIRKEDGFDKGHYRKPSEIRKRHEQDGRDKFTFNVEDQIPNSHKGN